MPSRSGAGSGATSPALARSASEPGGLPPASPGGQVPVKRQSLHRRAAEIVALSYLYAPSSTGSLQHGQLQRVRRALEDAEEEACGSGGRGATAGPDRNRQWTREQLAEQKARHRERSAPQEGPTWRLRRGKWVYEGGPPEEPISADEALRQFREEEERRGRGPAYRNGVAAAGLMRRYHKRNPFGGFYEVV